MIDHTSLSRRELVRKCQWLVDLLVEEQSRTTRDIARTTELPQWLVDDCIYELVQSGRARISPQSQIIWTGAE